MTFDKTIYNTTMGKWYYGNFHRLHHEFPKRPFGYPYAVHLLHIVRGYSYQNGFIFNGLCLFALLSAVYVLASRALGFRGGVARHAPAAGATPGNPVRHLQRI